MSSSTTDEIQKLKHLITTYPLIDNHCHPLLNPTHASSYHLESIVSEAHGDALEHSKNTLAHFRAVSMLAQKLGCAPTWEDVKRVRETREGWKEECFGGIQCVLMDDGFDRHGSVAAEKHDEYTRDGVRRIVRIETLAEDIMEGLINEEVASERTLDLGEMSSTWKERVTEGLLKEYQDENVVGFKSVVCYRTGLDVRVTGQFDSSMQGFKEFERWVQEARDGNYRLEYACLNDWVVQTACQLISDNGGKKSLQFHTGLGDNDINLVKANPAYLETIIKEYPKVPIVLLHSSYPYTREAGYLASVYKNVYLDFGEVFPMLSKEGQKSVIKEMLELTPINKLLWSSDGHWFPETYLLASMQTREVLYEVLAKWVEDGSLSYEQAADLTKAVFFENSNRLYNLNLEPFWDHPAPINVSSPPESPATFEQVFAQHKEVGFLRIQWVDYTGTLRLRVLPITSVKKKFEKGWDVSITEAAIGVLHDDVPASDMATAGLLDLKPAWSSLRPLTPGSTSTGGAQHASVMCDITQNSGAPLPLCPRTVLQTAISLAKESHNIDFLIGFETEVAFFSRSPDGSLITTTPHAHFWSVSSAFSPQNRLLCLEEISRNLEAAGIELIMFHPESADGQFEFVTGPLPPLAAVDTLYHTRQIISTTAARYNLHATLHPKPYHNQAGTSSHMHFSLSPPDKEFSFVSGILSHLRGISTISMPTVASYERLADNMWAGGTWVCWGEENREVPVRRITGRGNNHWEFRAVDGTANMYLVLAAVIRAGLLGVMEGREMRMRSCLGNPADLTDKQRDELGIVERLPTSLDEAVVNFDMDWELKEALGKGVAEKVIAMKRSEMVRMKGMGKEERWSWEVERY
ncbi:glutamine synthetase/guanido kinase [Wilcoxina mikolae CBS 423.85]|nr:glutamine synthetase/guanido kinase [Wilcoxina mikolae CBS 423.85]